MLWIFSFVVVVVCNDSILDDIAWTIRFEFYFSNNFVVYFIFLHITERKKPSRIFENVYLQYEINEFEQLKYVTAKNALWTNIHIYTQQNILYTDKTMQKSIFFVLFLLGGGGSNYT